MSRPRYRWWGYVRKMIRDYPGLRMDLDDKQQQSVVAGRSGMPGGGGNGRSLETAALQCLDVDDQRCLDAVARAVAITKLRSDGEERLRLIELMYWEKKPMTISKAADGVHVSERTAQEWHRIFVRCVAKCYGFQV